MTWSPSQQPFIEIRGAGRPPQRVLRNQRLRHDAVCKKGGLIRLGPHRRGELGDAVRSVLCASDLFAARSIR
jgi:hypothetical protein